MLSSRIGMDYKSILTGLVIGVIIGGLVGYLSAPAPDYTPYENQIAELGSQIASLQDEITQLQSQVGSLQNQLDYKNETMNLVKAQLSSQKDLIDELVDQIYVLIHVCNYTIGSWNNIGAWTGSASMKTEMFHVPSSQIRIMWSLDVTPFSNFTISMYEEDNDRLVLGWLNLEDDPDGMVYGDVRPGSYFLDFSVDECEYNVTVDVLIEAPSTWTYLEVSVSPRKPEFLAGEIVAFDIECDKPYNNSYFEVWDANGKLIWRSDHLTEWINVDGYWYVSYYQQLYNGEPMLLENDCSLGTWRWVWISETRSLSGAFEVVQRE